MPEFLKTHIPITHIGHASVISETCIKFEKGCPQLLSIKQIAVALVSSKLL